MIRWPLKSAGAIARLFRPIQNLDIYVEDQNDEAFYLVLFKAVAPPGTVIQRIVGLGGRDAVLAKASAYVDSQRALFLVDGDFPWVRGEDEPPIRRLHRLNCYCIENLLFNHHAAIEICAEEARCLSQRAEELLQYEDWVNTMKSLVPLFIRLAILNVADPSIKSVSAVFTRIVITDENKLPLVCALKLQAYMEEVEEILLGHFSQQDYDDALGGLGARISQLHDSLGVVSGKNVLLPLFYFHLKRICNASTTIPVLRHRLATKLQVNDLRELSNALTAAA